MKEIVVGVDDSDASVDAVRFAGRLAKDTGAHLTVVYVRHIPAVGYEGPPIVGPRQLERYYQQVEARVRGRVGRALAPLDVPWDL